MTNSEKPKPWARVFEFHIPDDGACVKIGDTNVNLHAHRNSWEQADAINAAIEAHPEMKRLRAVETAADKVLIAWGNVRPLLPIKFGGTIFTEARNAIKELESAKAQGREGGE